ncbi:uncharacterized protein EV420DRAFT_1644100 [Desarmillaria tabescens]|uniref:Uncharacterized protein n=1 Tax=Armillaria tabescens TaxID=1929756 RepID=A0AA39N4V7_ARMTA|nr:uncharacterized protein EV420DRAFT_1644100 [Desarmillaria tabescens]KAK0457355.1 hypothetical protein EV420DRAFT_1644100 [Desarmillaria tabescens]
MSAEQVSIAVLNQALLGAFGHGIHTCIVVFALWAIFSTKERRPKARNIMVFVIVCLYIFATLYVASDWIYAIDYSVGKESGSLSFVLYRWSGVVFILNPSIADGITIWRCWIIWGRRWSVVILPISLFLAQLVCGCVEFRYILNYTIIGYSPSELNWTMIFLSCSLGTTLWCTILIIYRILTVTKYTDDSTSTRIYRRIVEILVESASLYVIGLIGFMVLVTLNVIISLYPRTLFLSVAAISPTLIVARVASGNARPNDSWRAGNNNASSLRFRSTVRSISVDPDDELSANIDLEHGASESTNNCQPEGIVNSENGSGEPENRVTEGT